MHKNIITTCNSINPSGQKKFKVDEFLPLYSQCKKDKDVGNIEDFTEVLKLYDKGENGQMYFDELKHILLTLGKSNYHLSGLLWKTLGCVKYMV